MDRPGVRQVPEGSGEQGKKEKTGCKIICGAPTTLAVKGLTMMMMMMTQDRSTVAGDAVWTVATLDDRCHQSSNVLWTVMTHGGCNPVLFKMVNQAGLVIRGETHSSRECVVYFAGYRPALHHSRCLIPTPIIVTSLLSLSPKRLFFLEAWHRLPSR